MHIILLRPLVQNLTHDSQLGRYLLLEKLTPQLVVHLSEFGLAEKLLQHVTLFDIDRCRISLVNAGFICVFYLLFEI